MPYPRDSLRKDRPQPAKIFRGPISYSLARAYCHMLVYVPLTSKFTLKRAWSASSGAATTDWMVPAAKPAANVAGNDGGGWTRLIDCEDGGCTRPRICKYEV